MTHESPHTPEISCIIPTYNRARYIGRAIESVLEQECQNTIEIVVVDDGSTDRSAELIKDNYPSVRIIKNSSRKGPGQARNIGISASRGKIIMFLDSDDIWLPNHVKCLMTHFEAGAEVAYGIAQTLDETTGKTFTIPASGEEPRGHCMNAILKWCNIVPSSFGLRRDAAKKTGGFPNLSFGEDWLFFIRLSEHYHFYFCESVITRRLLHNESISASADIKHHALQLITAIITNLPGYHYGSPDPELVSTLHTQLRHIKKEGDKWRTVQDWYMSLKRHGLI